MLFLWDVVFLHPIFLVVILVELMLNKILVDYILETKYDVHVCRAEFQVPCAFSDNKSNLGRSDEQWPHSVGIIYVKILRDFHNLSVCLWGYNPAPLGINIGCHMHRMYAVPSFQFRVPSLPAIPTWRLILHKEERVHTQCKHKFHRHISWSYPMSENDQ